MPMRHVPAAHPEIATGIDGVGTDAVPSSSAAASSTDQPFTSPDGSSASADAARTSKNPPVAARSSSHPPEDLDDTRIGVREVELAARDATHLAVMPVRAEDGVDPRNQSKTGSSLARPRRRRALDDDRHSHHVLDAVHQTFLAASRAAWSDVPKA